MSEARPTELAPLPLGGIGRSSATSRRSAKRQLDAAEYSPETLYVGLEHIEANTGRLMPVTIGTGDVKSKKFLFDADTILYGRLRPYLNKVALPDAIGLCSTDVLPILPSDGLDRRLIAFLMRSQHFVRSAMSLVAGANLPRVSPVALQSIHVPLPPESERETIVELADLTASARIELDEARRLVEELESSILGAIFAGHSMASRDGP